MSLNKMLCTLGKFDIPIIQLQPPFVVDLLDSNVALFGSAMSGKTTFIKSLISILHKQYNEKQEQTFILDFGGALFQYQDLPLVRAYFDNSNEEYVKRVFKIMDNILKSNIKELNGKNYRDSDHQPVHTTFIIDNLNAFINEPRYTAYHEKLAKLCRDGLSKGITIVVTAVETKGILSYLGSFRQLIALEMPQDKYVEIFNGKVGLIGNNPGRGFANVTVKPEGVTGTFRMNMPYEVQLILPYSMNTADTVIETESSFLAKVREKFAFENGKYVKAASKYKTFPKELTRADYEKLRSPSEEDAALHSNSISVGLDYVDFNPIRINLDKSHVIAVYGKKEFGKTNLLNLIMTDLLKRKPDARIVLLDDGRKQLSPEMIDLPKTADIVRIDSFLETELAFNDGTSKTKKLSPLQQFYVYLNENYINIDKRFLAGIYGVSKELSKEFNRIPDCKLDENPFTLFVIQNKQVYLNTAENKFFINSMLPQLAAVAEEQRFAFIFSDVQKISDSEQNQFFNNVVSLAFLLDNIAEFAGERGQKTIFGNMDVKALKEDYARCEKGDGYFYDVEADNLLKSRFIKYKYGDTGETNGGIMKG